MKTPRHRSVKEKLTILILLTSIIPLLLLGVFSVYFLRTTTQTSLNDRLNEIVRSADELLDTTISTQIVDIESVSRTLIGEIDFSKDTLTQDDQSTILKTMYQYMRGNEAMQNMYLITDAGQAIGTSALPSLYELPRYRRWGIFHAADSSDRATFYPNMQNENERFINSYSIVYRLQQHGQKEAYLILDISTEFLQDILMSVKGTSFGYIQFIITSDIDMIIYNDSVFHSPIGFLNNVFKYDQLVIDDSQEIKTSLDQMTMVDRTNQNHGIKIYGLVPNEMLKDQVQDMSTTIIIMISITTLIVAVIGYLTTRHFTQPLLELVEKMRGYRPQENHPEVAISVDEIYELNNQFDDLIARSEEYHEQDKRKQESLRFAEIKALMSQINPHFLNNTLDSIKWQAKLNGVDSIAEMVTELSVLLKESMNTNAFVSVEEELRFIESYIHLQQFRYGKTLQYVSAIQPTTLNYQIPKLIMQPLVENATVHGIEPLGGHGTIEINVWSDDELLYISIADDGLGSDVEFAELRNKDSIGLLNVHQRIQLHFGESYGLKWESKKGIGTVVYIELPLDKIKEISNV
ncbi:hypothetical protein G7062_09370 [Erysipelothrix sp. HDW6C]|uniref:cache domain-containing sensor histidine kinase n=1 Tax=Erysipelothrix sp. HDW6C TaxID=2714930 RepID=UPI00140AFC52|nr:sensor histidine kinase [Erysipelothrix sp. HDW6C]QIK70499.1 hypothetical protein G7062_09370 [Erysipelothrix sp. HDW6C]